MSYNPEYVKSQLVEYYRLLKLAQTVSPYEGDYTSIMGLSSDCYAAARAHIKNLHPEGGFAATIAFTALKDEARSETMYQEA